MSETLLTDNWNSALNISQWIMTGDTTSAQNYSNQIALLSNQVVSLSNQVNNLNIGEVDTYLGTASYNSPVSFSNNYKRIAIYGSISQSSGSSRGLQINGYSIGTLQNGISSSFTGEIYANGKFMIITSSLTNPANSLILNQDPISSLSVTIDGNVTFSGNLYAYGTR
jgi:hypothetical protein